MPQAARTHKAHSRAPRKPRRGTAAQRGYDHQWTKVRAIHIASHPYCEDCKDEGKLNMRNLEVDHVIPIEVRPDLRLSLDNLRTRCRRHHKIKTDADKRQFAKGITMDIETTITVVCGPPGAGKTTYVNEHRGTDDVVFDLDMIAASINPHWEHISNRPDDVGSLLVQWRDSLMKRLKSRQLMHNAWVIIADERTAIDVAGDCGARVIQVLTGHPKALTGAP